MFSKNTDFNNYNDNTSLNNIQEKANNSNTNVFQNQFFSNTKITKENTNNTNNQYEKPKLIFSSNINNNFGQIEDNSKSLSPSLISQRLTFSYHLYKDQLKRKKTLILDIDETLVHSSFIPFNRAPDISLNINLNGLNKIVYVLKRPYVDEFLKELSNIFEIITFTASISQYAGPLLDQLDKFKFVSHRLFRENCLYEKGVYIKDLKKLGRDLKDMIIVDNNPISYIVNIDNGIPILTWYDNINDDELMKLVPILKYLGKVNDVRPVIRKIVDRKVNKIDFNVVNHIIKGNNNIKNNISAEKDFNTRIILYKTISSNITDSLSNMSYNEYEKYLGNINLNNLNNLNNNNNQNISTYNKNNISVINNIKKISNENENHNIINNIIKPQTCQKDINNSMNKNLNNTKNNIRNDINNNKNNNINLKNLNLNTNNNNTNDIDNKVNNNSNKIYNNINNKMNDHIKNNLLNNKNIKDNNYINEDSIKKNENDIINNNSNIKNNNNIKNYIHINDNENENKSSGSLKNNFNNEIRKLILKKSNNINKETIKNNNTNEENNKNNINNLKNIKKNYIIKKNNNNINDKTDINYNIKNNNIININKNIQIKKKDINNSNITSNNIINNSNNSININNINKVDPIFNKISFNNYLTNNILNKNSSNKKKFPEDSKSRKKYPKDSKNKQTMNNIKLIRNIKRIKSNKNQNSNRNALINIKSKNNLIKNNIKINNVNFNNEMILIHNSKSLTPIKDKINKISLKKTLETNGYEKKEKFFKKFNNKSNNKKEDFKSENKISKNMTKLKTNNNSFLRKKKYINTKTVNINIGTNEDENSLMNHSRYYSNNDLSEEKNIINTFKKLNIGNNNIKLNDQTYSRINNVLINSLSLDKLEQNLSINFNKNEPFLNKEKKILLDKSLFNEYAQIYAHKIRPSSPPLTNPIISIYNNQKMIENQEDINMSNNMGGSAYNTNKNQNDVNQIISYNMLFKNLKKNHKNYPNTELVSNFQVYKYNNKYLNN